MVATQYVLIVQKKMISYSKSSQIGKKVNPKQKNKAGKNVSRVYEWQQARAKLKLVYMSHKITRCEYVKEGHRRRCNIKFGLTFAHRKKRRDLEPGELGDINETLLLCQPHHELIEHDKYETTRLFELLRPL